MEKRTDELVKQNLGLVGLVVKDIVKGNQDRDDLFQIGSIGLIKAANGFDETKNIKFTTYAAQCIRNEILMEFRRQGGKSRNAPTLSFEAPIKENNEGKKLVVGDMIVDQKQNFEEQKELIEMLEEVLNYIINKLDFKERYIVLCRAGGITQDELAEQLQVSQSFTSRIEKNSIKKLTRFVNFNKKEVTGPYQVFVKESMIEIVFNGTEEQMNEVMRKIDFRESVPKFTINYDGEKLKIKIPGDPESMPFVAKLLNIIEN